MQKLLQQINIIKQNLCSTKTSKKHFWYDFFFSKHGTEHKGTFYIVYIHIEFLFNFVCIANNTPLSWIAFTFGWLNNVWAVSICQT